MSTRTQIADGTLTVHLPYSLVAQTRGAVVDALIAALEQGSIRRVRLDASALVNLDAAGIGALVRAARITREHVGERPVLARCSDRVVAALTATAVLPALMEVEPEEQA